MPTRLNRRHLLATTGSAVFFAPLAACSEQSKNILILGGTQYVGPAIVEALLASGHKVTLFNRGVTNPTLFPKLEKLRGDRQIGTQDLTALSTDVAWDAVIDTWPDNPHMIEASAQALKGKTSLYVFVSTIAVYRDKTVPGITEDAPLWDVKSYNPERPYRESKVLCERAVEEAFGSASLILRPPGIFGKRDQSWSLVYWLWRIRQGGPVLAPGDGSDPVQWTDVDDLAQFISHAVENNHTGIFNVIGPRRDPLTFGEFLERANKHFGNRAELTWVSDDFLANNEIRPVIDIPVWEPIERRAGRHTMSASKAIAAGLTFSTLEKTFDDALDWYDKVKSAQADPALDKSRPFNGITRQRELELLAKWNSL